MTNEIQTNQKSSIAIGAYQGSRSILLNSLSEIHSFATMVTKTDLVPKGYRGKPEDATVAIIYGMEIGLPPMASLQNISVVNGTPTVWGDAQLSLVQSSGKYEYHKSSYKGEYPKDDFTAVFEIKRIGAKEPVIKEFSVAQAKKAGLWGKVGTWSTHDKTMLLYKAKAFALREAFADILKGIHSKEEMEGEQLVDVTPSQSKTAAAHTAAETFEAAFNKPEPVLKSTIEPEQTIIDDYIQEFPEDKTEEIFKKHENAIKSYSNEKGLNSHFSYLDTKNDLDFLLESGRTDLIAQISHLKVEQLNKIKG